MGGKTGMNKLKLRELRPWIFFATGTRMAQPVALNLKTFPPDPVYGKAKDDDSSIVIDFGSCKTAAGWSDESEPFCMSYH